MYFRLSRMASKQRSVPLVIVCGALSTAGLDLLKLKSILFGFMLAEEWTHIFCNQVKVG